MGDDCLKTGDFSAPQFNLGEYVDEYQLEAKARVASKELFIDESKFGMKPPSPMKKGTFELNKNYESLHVGDLYQVPGKREAAAKLASKEKWLDEAGHGMKYASPCKKSATPGDRFGTIAQKIPDAFPPMGNYPPRGVREKIDVENLKDHRNIQTSPSKKGMGGYVGYPGVLLNPFPKFEADDYDAFRKKELADAAAHREAHAAVDELCRFRPSGNGKGFFDSQKTVDAPKVLLIDADCLIRDPTSLETANPKERAQMVAATKPWEESGDRTWRHAQPTKSWKYATINKFPEAIPDKYEDHVIRESQTPLRRMGWHRHVAAGVVSESVAERKPFKPSQGVPHTKTSTTIMFRGLRAK